MTGPSLGVAMCTYNGEAYLSEQLHSIARQDHLPDSLLVLDDASRDGTVDLVREFARTAPFPVRIEVNERNLGFRENFARAIQRVEGDVVVLADQDDVWYPGKLGRIATEFRADPAVGLVFSNADLVDDRLRPLGYGVWEAVGFTRARQTTVAQGRALHVLLRGNVVTGATMAFRSHFRDLVLPIPGESIHDGWIALLVSACARVVGIVDPLNAYRQHAGNQIGARRATLTTRVRGARTGQRSALREQSRMLEEARERLTRRGGARVGALGEIDEAIDHLRARIGMPSARTHRIPVVYRELMNGRYARCANGLSSALRDLVI